MLNPFRYLLNSAKQHPFLGAVAVFSMLILYRRLRSNSTPRKRALNNQGIAALLDDKGWAVTKRGICNGLRRVALFAYLSGQQHLFMKTLTALNYLDANDRELLAHMGTDSAPDTWDILALCDQIALNQDPDVYRPIYNDNNKGLLHVDGMSESAAIFEMENTREERKGIVNLHTGSRIYNYAQWLSMFEDLDKACQQLDSTDAPVAVSVTGNGHVHSFFYNVDKKKWHGLESNVISPNAFVHTMPAKSAARASWYMLWLFKLQNSSLLEARTYLDILSFFISNHYQMILSTEIHSTIHGGKIVAPLLLNWRAQQAVEAFDLKSLSDAEVQELGVEANSIRDEAMVIALERHPQGKRYQIFGFFAGC